MEEVEGHNGLRDQEVPSVLWECWIRTTQDGDKVGFECFDSAFGWVVTVVSRGYKLKIYFCVFLNVFDEDFGDLIVHSDDFCMETVFNEVVVGFFKTSLDF